jgi:uncharacterized small protein (DUF1192 family)
MARRAFTLSLSLAPEIARVLKARGAKEGKTAARVAAEIVSRAVGFKPTPLRSGAGSVSVEMLDHRIADLEQLVASLVAAKQRKS